MQPTLATQKQTPIQRWSAHPNPKSSTTHATHATHTHEPFKKDTKEDQVKKATNEIALQKRDSNAYLCFTDGSARPNPGHGGSGCILYLPGGHRIKSHESFPRQKVSNNYCELMAIQLALDVLAHHTPMQCKWYIWTDSDYCIGVLQRGWNPKANGELIESIKSQMEMLRHRRNLRDLILCWVPAHSNIPENESVDRLSKEANLASEGNRKIEPKYPHQSHLNLPMEYTPPPVSSSSAAAASSYVSKSRPENPQNSRTTTTSVTTKPSVLTPDQKNPAKHAVSHVSSDRNDKTPHVSSDVYIKSVRAPTLPGDSEDASNYNSYDVPHYNSSAPTMDEEEFATIMHTTDWRVPVLPRTNVFSKIFRPHTHREETAAADDSVFSFAKAGNSEKAKSTEKDRVQAAAAEAHIRIQKEWDKILAESREKMQESHWSSAQISDTTHRFLKSWRLSTQTPQKSAARDVAARGTESKATTHRRETTSFFDGGSSVAAASLTQTPWPVPDQTKFIADVCARAFLCAGPNFQCIDIQLVNGQVQDQTLVIAGCRMPASLFLRFFYSRVYSSITSSFSNDIKNAEITNTMNGVTSPCNCGKQADHVTTNTQEMNDQEDDDDANQREWKAHTERYRLEWEMMKDKLENSGMNSTDGEIAQDKWENENHSKFCCDQRHRRLDRGMSWSE